MVVLKEDPSVVRAGMPDGYELRYDFKSDLSNSVMCGSMRLAAPVKFEDARVFEFPLTNLSSPGPYYFSVRAHNSVGPSAWSRASAAYMLTCDAPAQMSSPLLVEAKSSTSLVISYQPPANLGSTMGGDVMEYELRYSRDPAALDRRLDDDNFFLDAGAGGASGSGTGDAQRIFLKRIRARGHSLQAQHAEVDKLITGKTYVFQIRAVSGYGVGQWSDISSPFETLSSPPSKPPPIMLAPGHDNPYSMAVRLMLPEANGKVVEHCRIRLLGPKWKNMPPATEWKELGIPPANMIESEDCELYEVEQNGSKQLVWQYTVLPLQPGAEYRYVWCCHNAIGDSEWSDESEPIKTQPSMPQPSTAPYIADEDDRKDCSLKVTWDPPFDNGSDIESYTLQWSSNPRFQNYTTVDDIKDNFYFLPELKPNEWYFFKVVAWNAIGQGNYSILDISRKAGQGKGAISTRAREPSPVINITVKPVDKVPGAVYLSWEKPLDNGGSIVTRYKICMSLTSDFEVYTEMVQKASRECKITDIKPDTVYYFDVLASNSVGYSDRTGEPATCRTNPVPPQKFIAPVRPDKPTIQVLEQGDWKNAEIQVNWRCPENYDQRKGFIYDVDKQTHMILHYAVQIRGGISSPLLTKDIQDSEHIGQVRDRQLVPRDSSNVTTFNHLTPGCYYQAFVQAFSAAGGSGWSVASDIVRAPPGLPDPVECMKLRESTIVTTDIEWVCPWGNGEDVTSFILRFRTDRVLQGWKDGTPDPPEEEEQTAGGYEEMLSSSNSWRPTVLLPIADCVVPIIERDSQVFEDADFSGRTCIWHVGGLQPASFYTFEVVAKNAIGNSEVCISDSLRSAGVPPGPCSAAQGTFELATTSSVTFLWRLPTYFGGEDLEGFDVAWTSLHFDDDIDFKDLKLDDILGRALDKVASDTTTFVAKGLQPGETVLPVIRAFNCKGTSAWSRLPEAAHAPALTALADLPGVLKEPPSLLRQASMDHKPYSLSASWKCPPQNGMWIKYFKLHFTPSSEEHGATVHEMTVYPEPGKRWKFDEAISSHFVHSELVPGVEYVLRVRATTDMGDAVSWSEPSEPNVAPPDNPAQPETPSSIWQWPYAIQLDWQEPWMKGAPLEKCEVLYSLSSLFSDPERVTDDVANKDLEKKCMIVEGFKAATTVWFRIRVQNIVGWSPWSKISQGFTTSACKPAAPEMPMIVHMTAHSLEVSWEEPDSHGAEIIDYKIILVDQERVYTLASTLKDFDETLQAKMNAAIDEDGDGDITLEAMKKAMQREEIQEAVQNICDDRDAELIERLQPRAHLVLDAASFPNPRLLSHFFGGLSGGIDLALAVRARNDKGFSDWCVPLDGLRTPSTVPEKCLPLVLLEATPNTFRCQYRLPFNSGELITSMEFLWCRVVGAMERHLALGGQVEFGRDERADQDGQGTWELPVPGPEIALPGCLGDPGEGMIFGLQPGTEYDVQVRAVNMKGSGEYSQKVRMISLAGKPDRPLNLRHANKTSSARPPAVQMLGDAAASGSGTSTRDLALVPVGMHGELLERPVLPTVFFSHTGRLHEPEDVSVAAADRFVQARRAQQLVPIQDTEDFSLPRR
mmetsp:Transcript_165854/g.527291  ORF Transcript_165854/g.527291 Transcript_165854/m.527291 type:complete len:1590 (-) Transcript_165854:67-4836(-)